MEKSKRRPIYDYLIVGAGLYGSVFARQMTDAGKECLVIDRRDHIGGNVHCEEIEGIQVHKYGAHIFHTSDPLVWSYVHKFASFNNFVNSPIAIYKDKVYNLPFNMNTFSQMWSIRTPAEAKAVIKQEIEKLDIGEHMRKLHGDVYSCGYAKKTASTVAKKVDGKVFKHKIKPVKLGVLVKDFGAIERKMDEILKKNAIPPKDRYITKTRKG